VNSCVEGSNPSFSVRFVVRLAVACSSVLVIGFAVGCGEDGGADASQLEDTPWVITSGSGITLPAMVAPSALFAAGEVSGSTGCNQYSGPYELDGDSLDIGTLTQTLIACVPPRDAIERAYVSALGQVAGWAVDGEELVLSDDDGSDLLSYEAGSIVGDWTVTGILSGDAFSSPIAGTEVTATFAEDGKLTGSAGCNNYMTTYTSDRDAIEIEPAAATRKFCPEPAGVMDQEAAFLSALADATRYRIDATTADIRNAEGQRLVGFERR
jgi:heat shock protein HslJ